MIGILRLAVAEDKPCNKRDSQAIDYLNRRLFGGLPSNVPVARFATFLYSASVT